MTIDDVHVHVVHCTHHNTRGRGEQSFLFRPSAPLSNFELAIAGGGSACASQASCKAQAVSRSVPEKKKKKNPPLRPSHNGQCSPHKVSFLSKSCRDGVLHIGCRRCLG